MLSNVATLSAGPWPFWTLAVSWTCAHRASNVGSHRTSWSCSAAARGSAVPAARLDIERAVPRGSRAYARRPQPGRHPGEHPDDDLQTGLDEDDPAADRLHECAEAETNA